MRTTIAVDDHILAAARRRGRERGQTLGQVVEDALRRELASATPVEAPEVPVFHGDGVRPGVDLESNRGLREALDSELALGDLR